MNEITALSTVFQKHPQHIAGLVADREFIGQHWFIFLNRRKIPLWIRLRANTLVQTAHGEQQIQHTLSWMQTGQRLRSRFQTEIYRKSMVCISILT